MTQFCRDSYTSTMDDLGHRTMISAMPLDAPGLCLFPSRIRSLSPIRDQFGLADWQTSSCHGSPVDNHWVKHGAPNQQSRRRILNGRSMWTVIIWATHIPTQSLGSFFPQIASPFMDNGCRLNTWEPCNQHQPASRPQDATNAQWDPKIRGSRPPSKVIRTCRVPGQRR